jgi:hypothetical protein
MRRALAGFTAGRDFAATGETHLAGCPSPCPEGYSVKQHTTLLNISQNVALLKFVCTSPLYLNLWYPAAGRGTQQETANCIQTQRRSLLSHSHSSGWQRQASLKNPHDRVLGDPSPPKTRPGEPCLDGGSGRQFPTYSQNKRLTCNCAKGWGYPASSGG